MAIKTESADSPESASPKMERYFRIRIEKSADKYAIDPVPVGINGYMRAIRRGHEVVVPESVVEALRNSTETTWVQDDDGPGGSDVRAIEAPRYPFSVLGEVQAPA